jgi:hypothetical protein
MDPIIISNPQVLSFYKENPSIDITAINIAFIDILKKLSTNLSQTIGNTVTSQILNIVSDIKTDIKQLGSNITIKLQDIKKEYIEDVKVIFTINQHNSKEILEKCSKLYEANQMKMMKLDEYISKFDPNKKPIVVTELKNKQIIENIENQENIINNNNVDTTNTIDFDTNETLNKNDESIQALIVDESILCDIVIQRFL